MSATGLDVLDKTAQATHLWLDEIMPGPDLFQPVRFQPVRRMWPESPTELDIQQPNDASRP
jgi:hypothetical protein